MPSVPKLVMLQTKQPWLLSNIINQPCGAYLQCCGLAKKKKKMESRKILILSACIVAPKFLVIFHAYWYDIYWKSSLFPLQSYRHQTYGTVWSPFVILAKLRSALTQHVCLRLSLQQMFEVKLNARSLRYYQAFWGAFAKLWKATTISFVISVRLSVRPSVRPCICPHGNHSAPTGQIFMKFDILVFCEKLFRKFGFQ
jgi:hypothetical protein